MKPLTLCIACLAAGGMTGFCVARWTATPTVPMPVKEVPSAGMGDLSLGDDELTALADRVADAVAQRLAPALARDARPGAPVADERARELAFARAAQIVDMMIANRRVTSDGLDEAHALLRETGQADRGYELQARVAAAINRGELTPEQAGWAPRR
jgi:hypothetical protein